MYLRVNADDLGLTSRVNDESFDLISRGLVDSASIIANAPEAREAIRRARKFPRCSFGVHLNVTQFQPLRPAAAFAPVLDEERNFTNVFWRVRKDDALRQAIYQEWSAQIERCLDLGLRPAHIDSHHDIHLFPEFLPVVFRLQRRFGIRRIRRGTRIPGATREFRRAIRDSIWIARCVFRRSELTDYRCGVHEFWKAVQSSARLAAGLKESSIELVVHPGNHFDSVFREETELLRAGWLAHLKERGFSANGATVPRSYGWSELL